MGAGCSNGRALEVQDSVITTKKIQLTSEGKEHLKSINAVTLSSNRESQPSGILKKPAQNENSEQQQPEKSVTKERRFPSGEHQMLWDAVETNETQSVEELLEKIAQDQQQLSEADLFDSQGNSMAHKAASLGHAEILMLLLERTGAKPDLQNAQLATPLHLACKNNRESVAKFLIGCGVDVNGQDENGQTPLLICCIHGNYDLAQLIIESSAAGHTPELLEIDMRDHRGLTALNCSAIKGDLKLSKLLIEKAGANVEQASPKGCTPAIYAARGGYEELLQYLLLVRKASPVKQDSSGATLLHHAVEKGNLNVLQTLLRIGGADISSAIEIADNAGRTPIFEAVDNSVSPDLLRLLIKKRQKKGNEGGFGAKVNVLNYNGQTPLFSAVREGNMSLIKVLIEFGESEVDLNGGEMVKDETPEDGQGPNNHQEGEEEDYYDSVEEKNFMEAYKNCMTPLQLSCILGQDDMALYLIDNAQANPNLQTNIKGYACLHLAVLANKPEMIIELLTRTNANPHLPDYSGRTFIEMVEQYIPGYLESFTSLLENLQVERLKRASDSDSSKHLLVATHYYNPDDEREIKGFKGDNPEADLEKQIEEMQQQEQLNTENEEASGGMAAAKNGGITQKKFLEMDDSEIEVEDGKQYEKEIENVFGRKIALGLISVNFKFKDLSLKIITKHAEKLLSPGTTTDSSFNLIEMVKACTIAVDLTCKEKVIKVFNLCLQLLTLLINSAKIEQSATAIDAFKRVFVDRSITLKLLQRSEEGNTRLTNKIHESLLDFSFHPRIGEAHVSSFILQRINSHNKQAAPSIVASKPPLADSRNSTIEQGSGLGSYKGLLAQLALLYKFVNSFGVSAKKRGPLNASDIFNAILPSLSHSSQDVRSASTKILLDVHRLSGAIKEERLTAVPEKQRAILIEKIKAQVVEKDQNQAIQRDYSEAEQSIDSARGAPLNSSRVNKGDDVEADTEGQKEEIQNWTGAKDQSLKAVLDYLGDGSSKKALPEEFLTNSTVLLKNCLEDNNFNLYIQSVDVASAFFNRALFTEIVLGSLQSLIKPVILRTTDTNTRIRKKSVELIYQVWSQQPPPTAVNSKNNTGSRSDSVPQIIADVICDQSLQERAIIGRLGLFIKRASMIDGGGYDEELSKKPHQVILGRNYEELTEFACQWCLHKNTKVRQNALKLIVEICRVNSVDPRGQPFKQRIINMILVLRASLRDPLVQKINEVCTQNEQGPYIDKNELELNLATKSSSNKRAASMDVHKSRAGASAAAGTAGSSSMLPDIGGAAQAGRARGRDENSGGDLPSLGGGNIISLSAVQPTIVLPHSEPLSDEQKEKSANLIELFGLELVTCLFSQFWANRFAAIEKVDEQLHNLDPNRRDAMSAEINRKNLPIENNFKTFLELIEKGCEDPVLKNLIAMIDLLKKALPTFFRYIQPIMIRKELMPLVSTLIKKTTDLKAKVREVAIDFCLYLSHQSPVGPEVMVNQVLVELEQIMTDQPASTTTSSNVAANMGNSHMISSCFKLLNQFQQQTKLLDKTLKTYPTQQQIFNRFIAIINLSLKHQNPQVRKEGEALFKLLYHEFGEKLDPLLTGQKPQLLTKILQEAKQEAGLNNVQGSQQQQEINIQRHQTMIRSEMLSSSTLTQLLKGQEEHLQNLKWPNPKKRLAAVVELKKAVQKELVGAQSHPQQARALFEPLSLLIRQLLADDEPDIYMETLLMLRAVVGALVPHMSTLDVHLMLGSFIGQIVANTVSGNIRTQIASDKVIIFFAKHSNIGPFVVAKDILKNIEKCIKAVQVITKREEQITVIQEKKPTVMRFLSILQLLLQHFSIVLCYQPEFYDKCVEIVADAMVLLASDDQAIKNLCVQLIVNLQKIDVKLLEQAIQKMDFSRKTPLRKAMIELEHQSRAGKSVLTQDHHAFSQTSSALGSQAGGGTGTAGSMVPASPMNVNRVDNKETRDSNFTQSSRTSLFSPGTTLRGASPGGAEALGMTGKDWSRKSIENTNFPQPYQPSGMNSTSGSFKNPEGRAMRRMISLENENPRASQTFSNAAIGSVLNSTGGMSAMQHQARLAMKQGEGSLGPITPGSTANKRELVLPEIVNPYSNTITPLASTTNFSNNQQLQQPTLQRITPGSIMNQTNKPQMNATGGAGFSSSANYGAPALKAAIQQASTPDQNSTMAINNQGIRPPLYVPQKREGGRAATGMLSGTGIQGLSQQSTTQQQQTPLLNRTGPLPSSYIPPLSDAQQQPAQQQQYKTDFNSNLYSGLLTSSAASTSGTLSSKNPARNKKQQMAPLFKGQLSAMNAQPVATFETNVTKYKEANNANNKGDFF